MATPHRNQKIITPPNTYAPIGHVTIEGKTYSVFIDNTFVKYTQDMWHRSGGYTSSTPDLKGLQASVKELNTLISIRTDDTVQEQIDSKEAKANLKTMAYQDATAVNITGGKINGVSIEESEITIVAGGSTTFIPLGGLLFQSTATTGNIGTGEDTLISYAMPGNVLSEDGDYIEIEAFGTVASNTNNKEIKLKIGSTTLITTGAVAADTGSWIIKCTIIRTGASTEKSIASIISDNALIVNSATYSNVVEDTATTLNIFCTGEATNDNDIVQEGLIIKWNKKI